MTSKIINMAEKLQDDDDRLFASLLRSEVIEDAGFSQQIVTRIRRGIWLRRLALPSALLLGGIIAGRSLLQLATVLPTIVDMLPAKQLVLPDMMLTQFPLMFTVGCLVVIAITTFKLSEE